MIDLAKTIGKVLLIIGVVIVILNYFITAGITVSDGDPTDKRASPLLVDTDSASFEPSWAGDFLHLDRVNDSTGAAVLLEAGSDTYQARKDVDIAEDDTWTASVWAEFDDSYGTSNGTVYSLNGRVLLQYNHTAQNWSAWYYDDGSRDSYVVEVNATKQPNTLQNIQVESNGTHLAIYRNNTRGDVANLSVTSTEDPIPNASNWAGRQDELRVFEDALTSSQRQQLIDDPIGPLPGANRTVRVMFDQNMGDSMPAYFAGTQVDLLGAEWDSGLTGQILNEGDDFTLNREEKTVATVDGGEVDGAPTVFIWYRWRPASWIVQYIGMFRGILTLLSLGALILGGKLAADAFDGF